MGSLDGRIALVTGAGRGIGRAEALYFAAEGAKVVVNDLGVGSEGMDADASIAHAVADEITASGGDAIASTDSVTDWDSARRMVDTAVGAFGDLHVVVNNAGIEINAALEDMTEDEFDRVIAVKLKGTFAVSRWAARYWRGQADRGADADRAIINTASGSGLVNPMPAQGACAAANAGVAAMTIVHSLELMRYRIRVNCLSPSMIRTRMTLQAPGMRDTPPVGRFDPRDPANIAPVAAYLATATCPLTGQVISVRGGSAIIHLDDRLQFAVE
jgi:NAD(P)-dependent dehydrogenase (short-subunit alcohol dehydrogenase family)